MDRTKRLAKAARERQQVADNPVATEVQDLEEMVLQSRERVKAAKAAKSHAAALRRELQELQEEEQSIAASEEVNLALFAAPSADPGAFMAATLKSAVITFIFSISIRKSYNILTNLSKGFYFFDVRPERIRAYRNLYPHIYDPYMDIHISI